MRNADTHVSPRYPDKVASWPSLNARAAQLIGGGGGGGRLRNYILQAKIYSVGERKTVEKAGFDRMGQEMLG